MSDIEQTNNSLIQMEVLDDHFYHDENHAVNEEVDANIIKERNEEIKQTTKDISILSEIFQTLQHMIHDQGIDLNFASKNIENTEIQTADAVKHLESAEQHQKQTQSMRDAGIIVSGAAIGSVGWIGGPIIGVPTTAIGVGLSVGVVCLLRKIGL
jgi:hypothetical protein